MEFPRAEKDFLVDTEFYTGFGKRSLTYHQSPGFSEFSLMLSLKDLVELKAYDRIQDAVSEKLQPLVILSYLLVFPFIGAVGQSCHEKIGILKTVIYLVLDFSDIQIFKLIPL